MPHNNTNLPMYRPEVLTRPKLEGGRRFVMKTEFTAAGDQPTAIVELSNGVNAGERDQVLLGATGTVAFRCSKRRSSFVSWSESVPAGGDTVTGGTSVRRTGAAGGVGSLFVTAGVASLISGDSGAALGAPSKSEF